MLCWCVMLTHPSVQLKKYNFWRKVYKWRTFKPMTKMSRSNCLNNLSLRPDCKMWNGQASLYVQYIRPFTHKILQSVYRASEAERNEQSTASVTTEIFKNAEMSPGDLQQPVVADDGSTVRERLRKLIVHETWAKEVIFWTLWLALDFSHGQFLQ